jgi:hypothetical protein
MMFLALLWWRPMRLMYAARPLSPRARIACGVGASAKSFRVAALTLRSVACADRMTAISS